MSFNIAKRLRVIHTAFVDMVSNLSGSYVMLRHIHHIEATSLTIFVEFGALKNICFKSQKSMQDS